MIRADDLPPSWMGQTNVTALEAIAITLPVGATIIEVGSFLGRSATIWAKTCDPTTRIFCVDQWDIDFFPPPILSAVADIEQHVASGFYEAFLDNMSPYPNVTSLRGVMPDEAIFEQLPERADLLFYDCGKGYNVPFTVLTRLLRRCRLVCGVHYQPNLYPHLVRAIDDVAANSGHIVEVVQQSSVWKYL